MGGDFRQGCTPQRVCGAVMGMGTALLLPCQALPGPPWAQLGTRGHRCLLCDQPRALPSAHVVFFTHLHPNLSPRSRQTQHSRVGAGAGWLPRQ